LPAIWLPDLYQNWTFTSEQMMIYQDTPRIVRRFLYFAILPGSGNHSALTIQGLAKQPPYHQTLRAKNLFLFF
jgi:hypothetical protein